MLFPKYNIIDSITSLTYKTARVPNNYTGYVMAKNTDNNQVWVLDKITVVATGKRKVPDFYRKRPPRQRKEKNTFGSEQKYTAFVKRTTHRGSKSFKAFIQVDNKKPHGLRGNSTFLDARDRVIAKLNEYKGFEFDEAYAHFKK